MFSKFGATVCLSVVICVQVPKSRCRCCFHDEWYESPLSKHLMTLVLSAPDTIVIVFFSLGISVGVNWICWFGRDRLTLILGCCHKFILVSIRTFRSYSIDGQQLERFIETVHCANRMKWRRQKLLLSNPKIPEQFSIRSLANRFQPM